MNDLQLDAHELYDPVDPASDRWAPANDATCLLFASLEACKDVVTSAHEWRHQSAGTSAAWGYW